jgi:hypothetical protein
MFVTICLLLGLLALLMMGIGAYLLVSGGTAPEPELPPAPVAPPPPPVSVEPKPRVVLTTIHWTTAKGRVVGKTQMDRRARRPQMVRVYRGKPAVFTASHEEGDVWVYRYLHDV